MDEDLPTASNGNITQYIKSVMRGRFLAMLTAGKTCLGHLYISNTNASFRHVL